MRQILRVIRNGAFGVAIAVGLAFGATQALSGTSDVALLPPDCTYPDYCEIDDLDCDEICEFGGTCLIPKHCCFCREK